MLRPCSCISSSCMEPPTLTQVEVSGSRRVGSGDVLPGTWPQFRVFIADSVYVPVCRPFLKLYQAMQPVYTSGI